MVVRMRTYIIIAMAALVVSCQKDICMDHHHDGMKLRVEFDWSQAAPSPATVTGMTLLLYPVEGGAPFRYALSDISSNVISVTSGSYHVICVNDDELLKLENTQSWETVSVTTSETEIVSRSLFNNTRTEVPRSESSLNERVLREPSLLYSDTCSSFYVRATNELQVLRMQPKMLLGTMHVKVENITNLQFLIAQSGAVTGLSSSINLSTQKGSEDHCTMPVSLSVTDDGILEGYLYYFGHCPTEEIEHDLMVYTMLVDTSKQGTEYNVTDQLHPDDPGGGGGGREGEDDDKKTEVTIPALDLPTPQPAEGGFSLQLDEWSTQSINIKM